LRKNGANIAKIADSEGFYHHKKAIELRL